MKVVLIAAAILAGTCSLCYAQDVACPPTGTKDAQVLRGFLEEQKKARLSPCLSDAIRQLGRLHDIEAVHLLVSYLDYLDPKTAPLPNGGATVWPNYPAMGALFQIGKPAIIELLSAISSGESPQLRKNAERVYADIFRDDLASGIRTMKTAELLARTDEERLRLKEARQKLTDECGTRNEKNIEECRNAAGG